VARPKISQPHLTTDLSVIQAVERSSRYSPSDFYPDTNPSFNPNNRGGRQ